MRNTLLSAAFLVLTAAASAQTVGPTYDQVTVTLSRTPDRGETVNRSASTYSGKSVSLRSLIAMAYGMNPKLIEGLPEAAANLRFNIDAVATTTPTGESTPMLKALLADHFGLQVHTRKQPMPVYLLTVAPGGLLIPASDPNDQRASGTTSGNGNLAAHGAEVRKIAQTLTGMVDRPVVDNTNLSGTYTFQVQYDSRDCSMTEHSKYVATALAAQTGFQLTPGEAPVKTLTIEHLDLSSIPGAPAMADTASIK